MASYKSKEFRPQNGGKLSPNLSLENTNVANYARKIDLRRYFDKEIRREGDAFFKPTKNTSYIPQSYPCRDENGLPLLDEPITLIEAAINPNGLDLTIVGTPTKLLRMIRTTNAFYVNKPDSDCDYFGASITGADSALKEFRIPSDWTDNDPNPFLAGYTFTLVESGANDGTYTIASDATYDGAEDETVITVAENIPADFDADGATTFHDGCITELFDGGGVDVSENLYYFGRFDRWVLIGDSFSEEGHRWEAETIGNYTVFNNGVDPLQIMNLSSFQSTPLYELREQGVVRVDTIGQFNGILMLGNITEIDVEDLSELMRGEDPDNPDPYGRYDSFAKEIRSQFRVLTGVAALPEKWAPIFSGTIESGSRVLVLDWIPKSLGLNDELIITGAAANGGNLVATIFGTGVPHFAPATVPDNGGTGYVTGTKLSTTTDGDGVGLKVDINETGGVVDDITISEIGTGYLAGDTITVVGGGNDCTYTIKPNEANGFRLDKLADTGLAGTSVQKNENLTLGPQPSAYDLQDKADAVLRIVAVRDRVAIFKSQTIFLGQATGQLDNPFRFQLTYRGDRTPFWRWTLTRIEEDYVIYAGNNTFFRYDLTAQKPKEIPNLSLASELFHDNTELDEKEQVYGFNSDVTREVWFCFPAQNKPVGIGAIAYDVRFDTVSEIARYYTAGTNARIERNTTGVDETPKVIDRNRKEETVTLLGTEEGALKIYGRTNEPRRELGGKENIYVTCALYSDDFVITQTGNAVSSNEDFFGPEMVGRYIQWEDKTISEITGYTDPQNITVSDSNNRTQPDICVYEGEYDSILQSGWVNMGDDFNEKDMRSYALLGGSDNETAIATVEIYGVTNATDDLTAGSKCIKELDLLNKRNLFPVFFRHNYFRDKIVITGRCDASIAARIYEWTVRRSRSITRVN
jgi:hypothetical protein